MNRVIKLFAFATLMYYGTDAPIKQYDNVKITCGEFKGLKGKVNYLWQDGHADITSWFGFKHHYVEDYQCIQKQ